MVNWDAIRKEWEATKIDDDNFSETEIRVIIELVPCGVFFSFVSKIGA
ncbi:hypothetical protein [Bacillus sp. 37MA]|nr:hypothetical protein [Bacillus sp. 37MA]